MRRTKLVAPAARTRPRSRSTVAGSFRWGAVGAAVVLGITVLAASPGTASASPSAASGHDSNAMCVDHFKLASSHALRADGARQSAAAGDGLARALDYTLNGSTVTEVVPPAGWSPVQATDQELKAYGFPERPKDTAKLADWSKAMGAWKSVGSTDMCTTRGRSGVTVTASSYNWAGGMGVNGSATQSTFTAAEGAWKQPSFVGTESCSGYSAYSIWAGLGGHNQSGLIQDGVDNIGMAPNDNYMWWEALNSARQNPEVAWGSSYVVPGHDVYARTTFDPSSGWASFFVEDLTTGMSHSAGMSSYAGASMWDYYDGTTADFITEAPTGGTAPGGLFYLRQPSSGSTYYWYAKANGNPIANYPSWAINEWGHSGNSMQYSSFNGVNAWYDYWHNCY